MRVPSTEKTTEEDPEKSWNEDVRSQCPLTSPVPLPFVPTSKGCTTRLSQTRFRTSSTQLLSDNPGLTSALRLFTHRLLRLISLHKCGHALMLFSTSTNLTRYSTAFATAILGGGLHSAIPCPYLCPQTLIRLNPRTRMQWSSIGWCDVAV